LLLGQFDDRETIRRHPGCEWQAGLSQSPVVVPKRRSGKCTARPGQIVVQDIMPDYY
jgi:hypothetical protein